MKKFFGQRGQSAVEFTLVLPFFVLVLLSTIYLGMFILDYVTLDNAANSAARHAAINNKNDDPTENYKITNGDKNKIGNTQLFLEWYELDKSNIDNSIKQDYGNYVQVDGDYKFVTAPLASAEYVRVMIQATCDLAEGNIFKNILPPAYTVSKTARLDK